jgi:hypothetical protein
MISCQEIKIPISIVQGSISAVAISQKRPRKGSNPNPRYNKAQPIPSCAEYCLGSGKDGCGDLKGV